MEILQMMKENRPISNKGVLLEEILDKTHGLYQLANRLNWDYLVNAYGPCYSENKGRPGIPIRVIAGLHYLKYLENESDESIVEKFRENPYWQYFCGFDTFQHRFPCHPTTLVKWRKKVGIEGVEKLLEETINTAKREALLPEKLCRGLNIDTTVQEKAVTFPTDSKLFYKMREKLVVLAKDRGIKLRQSYARLAKHALRKQYQYRHAGQMKRAGREMRRLKIFLRRVTRDIERKVSIKDPALRDSLKLSWRLLNQQKNDKKKLYSLHAPEVECIAKGKVHKKYEFGAKVSIATTCQEPWVVAIEAVHGNPYDGHTLKSAFKKAQKNTSIKADYLFVDKGYRGKAHYPKGVKVFVSGSRGLKGIFKKLLRGRSGIEPIIGHLKQDHRLNRNYLLGEAGDKINAVLSGCAFNLKKILRFINIEHRALQAAI